MIRIQRLPNAKSEVSGHEGPAIATWLNQSRVPGLGCDHRGVTGFFRLCRRLAPGIYWTFGPEFHGMVPYRRPTTIISTEGMM